VFGVCFFLQSDECKLKLYEVQVSIISAPWSYCSQSSLFNVLKVHFEEIREICIEVVEVMDSSGQAQVQV